MTRDAGSCAGGDSACASPLSVHDEQPVLVHDSVLLPEPVPDGEGVPVAEDVAVPAAEDDAVPVNVGVAVPVAVEFAVPVTADDAVPVTVDDVEPVTVADSVVINSATSDGDRARENTPARATAPVRYKFTELPQQHQGWKPTKSGVFAWVDAAPALSAPDATRAPSTYTVAVEPSYVKV